ncbi:spry domain-containing socs box protein 3 [Plakobranchus ocellatus]|uniref:Spry domain-containing socs box protein 3 n=1 Tax=Plakobranchus ocellatus TaxID=259542 RepID=A0AAV3YZD1_9GAST|nr:spry domain-containing socs box protein 3 [Plakobranchus ocellatus]
MAPEPPLTSLRSRESSVDGDNTNDEQKKSDIEKIIRSNAIHCRLSWLWDESDSSKEARVTDEGGCKTEVIFHPYWSNGTAGIRGSQPLVGELNYWEIHVGNRVFGTSLMFGVSTKRARLHANEFTNMIGEDAQGWGLSHRGRVYHNGQSRYYCKPFQEYTVVVVGVLLDRARGHLSFFKDGHNLGIAFTGMDKIEDDLYPIVCSTAAKTAMTVGRRQRSFLDLQDRCFHAVATSLFSDGRHKGKEKEAVDRLPLPTKMKRQILSVWAS